MTVRISGRNKLPGTITEIKLGGVMAQVGLRVGDNHLVAVITREACEELGLQVGQQVTALIKSTEIMLAVDDGLPLS